MATYYAVKAGGNWSAGATWSTISTKSSARTAGSTQPTSADTCILDDWSGNVTINTTTCTCKILSCTSNGNYAGTLTFTAGQILTIVTTGSITFASTMTISGTGKLVLSGTVSITSGGKTFSGVVDFNTSGTKTLVDNLTIAGLVTIVASTQTINATGAGAGDTMTCQGGFSINNSLAGTTDIVITGGVYQGNGVPSGTGAIKFQGNVSLYNCYTGTKPFKYISGTLDHTDSTLTISNNADVDLGGTTLNTVRLGGAMTLRSDIHCVSIDITATFTITITGAYNINCDYFTYSGSGSGALALPSGQSFNITTSFLILNQNSYQYEIKCATSNSTKAILNYSGSISSLKVANIKFTDIDCSGMAFPLYNWFGGTLTRTNNIINVTPSTFPVTQNVFGII